MKKVRVNEKYGVWYYEKEVDMECPDNRMYHIGGTDANGREWGWSTPFYNEILNFIKADDNTKEIYIRCY